MHVSIIYDADVGSSEDRECCDSFRRWSVQPEEGVGLQEIDHSLGRYVQSV